MTPVPRTPTRRTSSGAGRPISEPDLVATLELEDLPRLIGRRDLQRQRFEDAADPADLVGIRFRQLTLAEIEAVFQADSHVGAHDRGGRHDAHLEPSRTEDRPLVGITEQAI